MLFAKGKGDGKGFWALKTSVSPTACKSLSLPVPSGELMSLCRPLPQQRAGTAKEHVVATGTKSGAPRQYQGLLREAGHLGTVLYPPLPVELSSGTPRWCSPCSWPRSRASGDPQGPSGDSRPTQPGQQLLPSSISKAMQREIYTSCSSGP